MSHVVITGSEGRMAKILRDVASELNIQTKAFGKSPSSREVSDFLGSKGVIDFSSIAATAEILALAAKAKVPLVCGTTGWKSADERGKVFMEAAKLIPIVVDSNFSEGVEILCRLSEVLAAMSSAEIKLTDIHHIHKKDSPSGTAIKIKERILSSNPKAKVQIESIREGEVFGEHRVEIGLNDERIAISHSAESRKPFAEGAFKALAWAAKQGPGLYTMKDVLK